jgi:cephalosporin hydroxylase
VGNSGILDKEIREQKKMDQVTELNYITYQHIHKGKRYPRWQGRAVLKAPEDLLLYHQVIFENTPDFIIETGTKWGGSTVFLADMCKLVGNGVVISVDIAPRAQPQHERVKYLTGSSIDRSIVEQVKDLVKEGTVMVILDSKHTCNYVKWELFLYSKMVTAGQYIVVEDCYNGDMTISGVRDARDWFLKRTNKFELIDLSNQFLIGLTRDGWIRRKI